MPVRFPFGTVLFLCAVLSALSKVENSVTSLGLSPSLGGKVYNLRLVGQRTVRISGSLNEWCYLLTGGESSLQFRDAESVSASH